MNRFKKFLIFLQRPDNLSVYVYMIAIGLFITPYLLRQQFISIYSSRTYLWALNYIALFALFLVALYNILNKNTTIWYLFPAFSIIVLLPTQLTYPIQWGTIFVFICCCIIPQYIIFAEFNIPKRNVIIRHFLIFFNTIIFILFITALIDKLFDRFIIKQLADLFSCDSGIAGFAYPKDNEHNRFFSIFGHPLTNAFLFNFCYTLNILYNKSHKILLPNYVWAIITLFSLICCGGKTGITIGIIITIITFFRKWQFYALSITLIPIAYISGLLDVLIYRFTKIPLTSGRITGLLLLFEDDRIPLRFFLGHGSQLDTVYIGEQFSFLSTSREFPLIDHALRYGILFALLLLLPPFIYVTIRLWREKRFTDWFFWCLLYAEINTYNGFSSRLDVSFIFYFLTFILLNITVCDNHSRISD